MNWYSIGSYQFTKDNPDKGTETSQKHLLKKSNGFCLQKITPIRGRKHYQAKSDGYVNSQFTKDNPDKGTETQITDLIANITRFTKDNPDKGTETLYVFEYRFSRLVCVYKR